MNVTQAFLLTSARSGSEIATAGRTRRLASVALALAFAVVVLGAYVRLSDAGLGCPDWPGCYGQLAAPHDEEARLAARAAFPHAPVDAPKAWKEMVHRYLAGTLGLFALAIFLDAVRTRKRLPAVPTVLLGVIVTQAALGMWTVTWKLMPLVVMGHLLGGLTTLALLAWLAQPLDAPSPPRASPGLRSGAILGLALLVLQIALGGWVSANDAALACGTLPTCLGAWVPAMDFAGGFDPWRAPASGPFAALAAIQWTHRLGALVVVFALGVLGLRLVRVLRPWGGVLLGLLLTQFALGLANVAMARPLPLAVLHNAVAAALVIVLVVINHRLSVKETS